MTGETAAAGYDHGSVIEAEAPAAAAALAGAAVGARHRFDVLLWLSVAWLVLIILASAFASFLPLASPNDITGPINLPIFHDYGNSLILGTDSFGRSLLSRSIYGARTSLIIGVSAATAGCVVGGVIGLLAGYVRGVTDRIASFVIDSLLAFPALVVLLALTAILQPQLSTIVLGLSLLSMPAFARLERGSALNYAERPFVIAARSYGTSRLRIAFAHVLPNSVVTMVTYLPTIIAALIVAEGSLSFLGLGVPPPTVTWGGMILDGEPNLALAPNQVLVPAAFIFVTVFALNILGERIRGRLDSRDRG
jgi:peptide/nickel transport system permease protein